MSGDPLCIPGVGICFVTYSRASLKGSDIIIRWAKVQFCFSQHKISWGHVADIPLSGLAQSPASAPRSPKISATSNGGSMVPKSPSVVPRSPKISASNNGGPMVPKTPSPLPPARAADQAEAAGRKPSNISLRSNVSTCVGTWHVSHYCHVSRVTLLPRVTCPECNVSPSPAWSRTPASSTCGRCGPWPAPKSGSARR